MQILAVQTEPSMASELQARAVVGWLLLGELLPGLMRCLMDMGAQRENAKLGLQHCGLLDGLPGDGSAGRVSYFLQLDKSNES